MDRDATNAEAGQTGRKRQRVILLLLIALIVLLLIVILLPRDKKSNGTDAVNATAAPVSTEEAHATDAVLREGDFAYRLTAEGAEILGWYGSEEQLILPAELGGKAVVCLVSLREDEDPPCRTVQLPACLTTVCAGAFRQCELLLAITVESGNPAYKAEGGVLYSLDGSELVCCPPGYNGALTLPETVTTLTDHALDNCIALTALELPDGVKVMGEWSLYNCCGLTALTLPKGLEYIGTLALYNCSALTSLTLPASLNELGDRVFELCSFTSFGLAEGSADFSLHDNALYSADGRTLYYLYDKNLTRYTVQPGTEILVGGCMADMPALMKVTLPDSLKTIGYYAFARSGLVDSVTLPDGLTRICPYAFCFCTKLTGVRVASGALTIDETAFYCCTALRVTVDDLNPNYCSLDGALYNKAVTRLLFYPYTEGELQLPDTVTEQSPYATCWK